MREKPHPHWLFRARLAHERLQSEPSRWPIKPTWADVMQLLREAQFTDDHELTERFTLHALAMLIEVEEGGGV